MEDGCSVTKNHFPTNPGFKGKSERENTAVRFDLPFAIREVFELKMFTVTAILFACLSIFFSVSQPPYPKTQDFPYNYN